MARLLLVYLVSFGLPEEKRRIRRVGGPLFCHTWPLRTMQQLVATWTGHVRETHQVVRLCGATTDSKSLGRLRTDFDLLLKYASVR